MKTDADDPAAAVMLRRTRRVIWWRSRRTWLTSENRDEYDN